MDRTNFGWTSEQAFEQIPIPDATALTVHTERVYPCDNVKIVSTIGESGIPVLPPGVNTGIPNLENLYFDIGFDVSLSSLGNNSPFDLSSVAGNFTLKITSGLYQIALLQSQ
ncbi:MAG: hypothetical protein IPK10_15315 [Bacteroidetes bacterium]|nr:hypothetical protein [Bacteroidota bacterium]